MHPQPQTACIANYKTVFLIKKSPNSHENCVFKLILILVYEWDSIPLQTSFIIQFSEKGYSYPFPQIHSLTHMMKGDNNQPVHRPFYTHGYCAAK